MVDIPPPSVVAGSAPSSSPGTYKPKPQYTSYGYLGDYVPSQSTSKGVFKPSSQQPTVSTTSSSSSSSHTPGTSHSFLPASSHQGEPYPSVVAGSAPSSSPGTNKPKPQYTSYGYSGDYVPSQSTTKESLANPGSSFSELRSGNNRSPSFDYGYSSSASTPALDPRPINVMPKQLPKKSAGDLKRELNSEIISKASKKYTTNSNYQPSLFKNNSGFVGSSSSNCSSGDSDGSALAENNRPTCGLTSEVITDFPVSINNQFYGYSAFLRYMEKERLKYISQSSLGQQYTSKCPIGDSMPLVLHNAIAAWQENQSLNTALYDFTDNPIESLSKMDYLPRF